MRVLGHQKVCKTIAIWLARFDSFHFHEISLKFLSSEAERHLYTVDVEISKFSGTTIFMEVLV